MAENQDPNIEGPNVEARAEFINSGTTDVKSFLPFGTGFHDPNLVTFNPEPNPVQLENPSMPSQTATIQKDPIRDTAVGFNPWDKNQLAKTATGSQSFAENLGKKLSHQLKNLEDPNQYAKSFMYDASSSGAHKARYKAYGQKTYDRIGFNPELNNEEVFNANTSIVDDYVRMATHAAWPMFTLGLIANPKSYAQMFQGNIGQDIDEATDYEEYNAIGMSTKGGIGGFFNNTLNSLAYSAGIMFEAAAEYAAIGAIEGSIVGPEGTVAGGLIGGAAGALKGLASLPKNLYNMGKYGGKMLTNLKQLENYNAAKQAFTAASKGTWNFINPINNTTTAFEEASNLSGLARTAKTSAGLFRDVIGINMGLSEGRLEGGFVENNTYSKLYDEFWKRNNRAPSDEEQVNMRKQAKTAGFQDTWKNGLLVFYSNKIAFPNLVKGNMFAGQSRTVRSIGKEFDIVFNAGKGSAAKAVTEGTYDIVDYNLKNALKGFVKPANFGKASLAYFKTNLTEGAQEVMQDILAKSTEDYYVNSFYDPAKATFDYSMATLGNAFGHQASAEGFETFMSGFVMGGLMRPFNGAVPRYASILYNKYTMDPVEYETYMDERKSYGEAVKNAMNNMHQNPVDFLNERMRNYGDQSTIAKVINDEDTDAKEKFDAVNASFTSDVLTSLNAGTYKVFKDNFAKYGTLSDSDLEQALEIKPGEGSKMRQKLQEYSKKADKIQERWEFAQNNLANKKLKLQNFTEGTPEYNKAAIYNKAIDRGIYNLVFLGQSYDENLERVVGITNKLNGAFTFANLPSANFQTLTDQTRLTNTIDMLSTEIESLKNLDDPKAQAQIKEKQEMLDVLSEFEEKQSNFNKMQAVEVFEEAKKRVKEEGKEDADATAQAFDELINYYKENGQDPVAEYKGALEKVLKKLAGSELQYQAAMISMDRQGDGSYMGGIDTLFNDLKDLHKLEHDNRNIIPYINMLMQPASFYEHVERNFEWMRNLYMNRENYYKEIIDQAIKAKENNDLLKSLADDNIYVDLEEFADWVEDPNNLPSYFIEGSKGQERIIPAGSLAYEQYAQQFIMVARMQENKAAGDPIDREAQLENAIQDLLSQKQVEVEKAEENFKSDIQKETGQTLEELQKIEQEGKEVVKPISEDAKKAQIQKLMDVVLLFNTNDPVVQIDKLQEAFRLAGLPEETFGQNAIDIEVSKLQTDQQRLIAEVVPIFNSFEQTYDQGIREKAAYGTAAAMAIIDREIEKINESEGEVTEIEPVEIIKDTQSWKDYQAVLKEIDDRYAELIQELTDSFAKQGITPATIQRNVLIPTNTSWAEIEKLAPDLFEMLDKKFADEISISPEEDKYDLVRANWLEQQGDIIQEYNDRKLAEKILQEQEAKQFKAPKFKFIKLPKGYEINITSRITPLTLLRDTYQNMLDSGERTSEKTGKILKLTDKQKQDILDDLGQLDNAINFLREQGIQTENSSFDKSLQIFNDLIIARQNEIEKVFDEEGNLVSRKIDGKTAERVTKKAEELDIQLTPGKKPFSFYALDTQIKTIKDEEGVEQEVEIPSPILSAFDSIMADDSIKPEDKLDAFMASFEAFAKSTKTSVFKDKNQKGLNVEKFRALREALEDPTTQSSNISAQKTDIERKTKEELFPIDSLHKGKESGDTLKVIGYTKDGVRFQIQTEGTLKPTKNLVLSELKRLIKEGKLTSDVYTELAALEQPSSGREAQKADIERRQRVADIITSQLELGIELPKILETLAEQGYVEKINNSAFFKQTAGRDAIVFNIDGAIIPIYRSSKGTSSKTKGKWYPFFFNAGDWLVKAGSDSYKDGYNNPIIKQILDSLNNNYKYDKSIATVEGNNKKILSLLGLEGFEEDNYGIYDYQNYAAIATILKDWQNKLGNIDVTGYQEYLDGASSSLIKTNPTLRTDIEKAFNQVSKLFAELAALEQPSDIEAKKADIERRRKEELKEYANDIVERVEDYEVIDENGDTLFIQVRYKKDGSKQVLTGLEKNNYGNVAIAGSVISDTFYEDIYEKVTKTGERTGGEANLNGRENKINAKYDAELAKELYKEMKVGKLVTNMTPAEQQVADKYITEELRKSVDAELEALEQPISGINSNFTRENVIKAVNQLAFREAAEIGNMIDNLIKDFLTREGLTFKKVEKPEKMSQKAFDALFGDQGVITRFRDGIIDGDYMVVGASDMVFDKELFENGLVGETDLIAINADGDFNIIDVKALKKGSWDKFDADTQLEEKINALTEEGVSEEDIEKNADVVKLRKDAKFSKKQYFRLQQSIYRNLFYNMTGMMPKRIGLMPLEVEYDTEGNLINAGLASIVPADDTTIELEYFDVVESIVPLKAQPKKISQETPKDEGLVEEELPIEPTIADYVGRRVVYAGVVGVLKAEVDGTFSIVNKDGIETINFEGNALINKNLTLSQVGLTPIRKTQRPFETVSVNGVNYKVSILGENTAEINGVIYRINWTGTAEEKTIASLTYRANDAEIAELELKKEILEEKIDVARDEYASFLPKSVSVDYERRITAITKKLTTEEDSAIKQELLKTRTALEKELQTGKIKQNAKMQQIGMDRLQLDKINAEINGLRENNPKRTMRGGNLNDLIFVINSSPENFKLYKGKNSADQKKDLKTINSLSVSSAIASKIDDILAENFPDTLNTLIEKGVGAVSATGLDGIFNWANNTIVQLEILSSREAAKGNITTDIQNQINAIYTLLNDLELIKLTKNGEISKRQSKEVKNIFGESKVPDRTSIPQNEGVTGGQATGVLEPQGGKPSTDEMKSRIAESNITSASLLSSLDTEEGTTTKKGAKFIDAIKKANLDTINEAYINALEELKNNPGTINTTELQDAFEQRMQLLNVDILFDVLEKNDLLLPKSPIFGNTEVSPVTVYKKGPNSIVIQDVNTGATETFTAAQINENFTRMTEEAMAKEDGVQLTPQDVADFQKNTETINATLEDTEALNAAAKAVEEAKIKGTFRNQLKNKKCNI